MVGVHRDRGALATIGLHPVEDPSRFGVVPTDEAGRVLAFVEKPPRDEAPSNEINAGVYVLEPSVVDLIAPDQRVSVQRVTFPELAASGVLFAVVDTNYWLDTGTPEAFLQAHWDILDGRRAVASVPAVSAGNWIHERATVHSDAVVTRSTIDRDCHVEAGAIVRDSILLPGAIIRSGARVVGSIIGAGSSIGERATLAATCVVGAAEVVDADAHLDSGARVGSPS